MTAFVKPGWSAPSTILFACSIPVNQKALSFARADAVKFGAKLILFHAYDTLGGATSKPASTPLYDYSAAARSEMLQLEPLSQQVRDAGVDCEVVVRPGLVADQIVAFLREREIDRVVMGAHSPGPIGRILGGSLAEAVLRAIRVPTCVIGPSVVDGASRNFAIHTVLCAVSLLKTSHLVVEFAAELAAQHDARLVLQHVIWRPERSATPTSRTAEQIELELISMVPAQLQGKIDVQAKVVKGDPAAEVLSQGQIQKADLLVLGAQSASALAAIARRGVVYKVMVGSQCPVITLCLS